MDPEIIDEQQPIEDEATVRERTEAAFAEGFGSNVASERKTREKTDAKPAAASAPAADEKPAAEPAPKAEPPAADPPADPYEGLPQAVKDRLAKVDNIEHELRTNAGRFSALQKEFNAFKSATVATTPATPAAPAKLAKRELVRGELPEAAEMVDEADARHNARFSELEQKLATIIPPKSSEPETHREEQPREIAALTKVHPDWAKTLQATDFHLWLTQQPPEYAADIRETDSAVVISAALTKFDAQRVQQAEKQRAKDAVAASRTNRVASSVQPTRGGARPVNTPEIEDAEAAFLAGFKARTG